MFIRLLSVG